MLKQLVLVLLGVIFASANVQSATFGKLFVIPVDGRVDAQTLYLSAVTFPAAGTRTALYVATEHDSGRPVDVVTERSLHPVLRERVLREARPL